MLCRGNTDQHPRCLALATTTHKTEGRPQALPEPWPSPHPTLASPTSFFCSMAWCMSLASFFFSSSRMDGESEWSSVLGNFLPKTQAIGTVDSERLGQPGTGRNPWRQAPTGREGALPHLSEKNGVLRGREGRAGEQAGAGDGRDWCQCDLRCWVIGAGGQVGRWGNGWARRSQALRHSLQQLQQPLPILQPEVLGQILPLHGAQTHGGRDLMAQRPNLHSETGVAELRGGGRACFSPPPAFQGPTEGGCLRDSGKMAGGCLSAGSSGCVGWEIWLPSNKSLGSVNHKRNPDFAL